MPIFYDKMALRISKRWKAFLNIEAGLTRLTSRSQSVQVDSEAQTLETKQAVFDEQLVQKIQDLEQMTKSLAKKERQIDQLQSKLAKSEAINRLDAVSYEGTVLPSKYLRPCGANFQRDDFYLNAARSNVDYLIKECELNTDSRILDVGSGPGRIAIGILDRLGEIRQYCGVDVSEHSIRWGQRHITRKYPEFEFAHIDVENSRYNPDGSNIDTGFAFPFADNAFDVICLYSVFTHMVTEDVRVYLKEFDRMLAPSGKLFLTAFVEDNVPDMSENPEGYLGREWKGSLHCVRYERHFFESLLEENGFRVEDTTKSPVEGNTEADVGQQGMCISRKGD